MKTIRKRIPLVLALCLCVALMLPGACASADNIGTYYLGEEMGWIPFYTTGLPIISIEKTSGGLPGDVELFWDDNNLYISGVPNQTGNFIVEYLVTTAEGSAYTTVSFSVERKAETPTVNYDGEIEITKSPTGERVEAGGSAKFVARANNAERIEWRLVSNDTTNTVHCSGAAEYFPGLQVSGLGTETLVLSNIPRTLDGWRVEAQFWAGNRHAESYGAEITIVDENGSPIRNQVQQPTVTQEPTFGFATPNVGSNDLPVDNEAKTANIVAQPESVTLQPGDSYTIGVIATSPNNGTLSYQWYSAAVNNRSASLPISGASDASYTINQPDGTAYYWVAVWNTKDGARSQAVYSEAAEVTIAVPATPTPVPTPVFTPVPTPTPRAGIPSNINTQLVLFGIIGVLALIALIGLVIYLRADAKQAESEREEEREHKRN